MIVAMAGVLVVQVSRDKVIGVGGMRHSFVTAPALMLVADLVFAARVTRGAVVRIGRRYLDDVFVDMVLVHKVKVAVVQMVDVLGVSNLGMRTTGTVLVRMPAVRFVVHMRSIPPGRFYRKSY
ncbi:MAG TPA: hypothetical protein VGF86_07880 [Candidatus Tumulicola sp.]|jgi:hypothetical protein